MSESFYQIARKIEEDIEEMEEILEWTRDYLARLEEAYDSSRS
jgi:hypothetical protein